MKDRLSALLTVKSLVTVTLTGVFAALALQRCVSAQEYFVYPQGACRIRKAAKPPTAAQYFKFFIPMD